MLGFAGRFETPCGLTFVEIRDFENYFVEDRNVAFNGSNERECQTNGRIQRVVKQKRFGCNDRSN